MPTKHDETVETQSKTSQPLLRRLVTAVKPLWTECNELILNIETQESHRVLGVASNSSRPWWRAEFSEKAVHDDGTSYGSPDYWYVRKIVRIAKPGPADVVYDLGSGKGRILCVLARKRVRKCVGVELFEPLCEMARKNAARLRGRKSPIEVICDDAAKADLSEGTIYFMFNPFGPATMRDVIGNIHTSLLYNPRTITVVYYNALYEPVLEAGGWLERYYHFDTAGGLRVSFWRNRRLEGA